MSTRFTRRARTGQTIVRLLPAYTWYAILKRLVPLPRLAQLAWKDASSERDLPVERQVIAAVFRLRSWFGGDADCVQASLVLYRELSRIGAEPVLTVGFRRADNTMQGHAWVSVDGRPVFREGTERPFLTTLQFGHRGTLIGDASDAGP